MRHAVVFGTRPEWIKLKSVVRHLRGDTLLVYTGQSPDLVYDDEFRDFDVRVVSMHERLPSELSRRMSEILTFVVDQIEEYVPDVVIVQGDTISAFCGAVAGQLDGARVVHVEAGMRSGCDDEPWPEERLRRAITALADTHYAASYTSFVELQREGVETTFVGSTGLDETARIVSASAGLMPARFDAMDAYVIVTCHRRENAHRLQELMDFLCQHGAGPLEIVVVAHPNWPDDLRTHGLQVIEPMRHRTMVEVIRGSTGVMTDSGGLSEECAWLGKPVWVLRQHTERPEVVWADHSNGLGWDYQMIADWLESLPEAGSYLGTDAFGQGSAGQMIAELIRRS